MELACSSVQPVPALFKVNIPDSLNANKSPLVAKCAWLHAPPDGSAGKLGLRLVSVKLIECMTPFAVVISILLFESSISKSVMKFSSGSSISKRSIALGEDCASNTMTNVPMAAYILPSAG